METLLEIAKRLGIKPNIDMTKEEYVGIVAALKEEVLKYHKGGEMLKFFAEEEERLKDVVYQVHKACKRDWDVEQFSSNLDYFVQADSNDFVVHDQAGRSGTAMGGSFVYHDARERGSKVVERFALDLKQDSPEFPAVIDELDKFIVEHKSAFKIVTKSAANRTDTMNIYMFKKITPEIAAQVYEIVKPVLNGDNHDYLDGVDIQIKDHTIKGIKYGPDPSHAAPSSDISKHVLNQLHKDFGTKSLDYLRTDISMSLGELSAVLEELDLFYYLHGQEGKNPFTLAHRYGRVSGKDDFDRLGYIRDSYEPIDIASFLSQNKESNKETVVAPVFQEDEKTNVLLDKIATGNVSSDKRLKDLWVNRLVNALNEEGSILDAEWQIDANYKSENGYRLILVGNASKLSNRTDEIFDDLSASHLLSDSEIYLAVNKAERIPEIIISSKAKVSDIKGFIEQIRTEYAEKLEANSKVYDSFKLNTEEDLTLVSKGRAEPLEKGAYVEELAVPANRGRTAPAEENVYVEEEVVPVNRGRTAPAASDADSLMSQRREKAQKLADALNDYGVPYREYQKWQVVDDPQYGPTIRLIDTINDGADTSLTYDESRALGASLARVGIFDATRYMVSAQEYLAIVNETGIYPTGVKIKGYVKDLSVSLYLCLDENVDIDKVLHNIDKHYAGALAKEFLRKNKDDEEQGGSFVGRKYFSPPDFEKREALVKSKDKVVQELIGVLNNIGSVTHPNWEWRLVKNKEGQRYHRLHLINKEDAGKTLSKASLEQLSSALNKIGISRKTSEGEMEQKKLTFTLEEQFGKVIPAINSGAEVTVGAIKKVVEKAGIYFNKIKDRTVVSAKQAKSTVLTDVAKTDNWQRLADVLNDIGSPYHPEQEWKVVKQDKGYKLCLVGIDDQSNTFPAKYLSSLAEALKKVGVENKTDFELSGEQAIGEGFDFVLDNRSTARHQLPVIVAVGKYRSDSIDRTISRIKQSYADALQDTFSKEGKATRSLDVDFVRKLKDSNVH